MTSSAITTTVSPVGDLDLVDVEVAAEIHRPVGAVLQLSVRAGVVEVVGAGSTVHGAGRSPVVRRTALTCGPMTR